MKKSFGYTLAELLITIAIVGILASIALPSFVQIIAENRLKQSAESTASLLRRSQAKALELSTLVTVTVTSSMMYANANNMGPFNTIFPDGVQASGASSVVFAPDGRASTSGSIVFTPTTTLSVNPKTVTVTPLGQVITEY